MTKSILALARPLLIGQVAFMAYPAIDTVMVGHFSRVHLAAVGLGASIYGTVSFCLVGPISALNPIIAQHFGGLRARAVGESYVQGLWFALALGACGVALLAFSHIWLGFISAPTAVRHVAVQYLQVASVALPGMLLFRATFALHTAVSRPRTMMAIQVVGLGLKAACSGALVYGALGLPALGAVGCALSSCIVAWTILTMAWLETLRHPAYDGFVIRFDWPRWRYFEEMLRLGVPMGAAVALEASSFSLMAVFIARLGATILGAHQIVLNLGALAFQVPIALGIAIATLTGQALGAGDAARARQAASAGLWIGMIAAAATAGALWTFRRAIIGAYTNDAAVAAVALSLIGYLAAFHVFDSLQGILAFVLRAYKVTVAPVVVYAGVLWGLGLGGGYVVGFTPLVGPPRGAAGMWFMQAVAVCLAALLLLAYYVGVVDSRPRAPAMIEEPAGRVLRF